MSNHMQISLDQNEVELAIEEYIRRQVTIKTKDKLVISFKAGRGDSGLEAYLSIPTPESTITSGTITRAPIITTGSLSVTDLEPNTKLLNSSTTVEAEEDTSEEVDNSTTKSTLTIFRKPN